MTDTKDVAYVRERLCIASDVLNEIFVKTKKMSEENTKLKELLKECREYIEYVGYLGADTILEKIDEVLK